MKLKDFEEQMLKWNNVGKDTTQKHREVFPAPKKDKKGKMIQDKAGNRYHAPATDAKCPICKKIINAHDKYMKLQLDTFGITGIPFESMISAIKITRGIIKMLEEENGK